jgi:hypothetical protein
MSLFSVPPERAIRFKPSTCKLDRLLGRQPHQRAVSFPSVEGVGSVSSTRTTPDPLLQAPSPAVVLPKGYWSGDETNLNLRVRGPRQRRALGLA